MSYRKNRRRVGDEKNKKDYINNKPYCECCGGHYMVKVHHHIPQQYKYLGETYILDIPSNYSSLCQNCHSIIEHNESQYYRDLRCNKPFEYWHTLKDGRIPKDIIKESEYDT